MGMAAVQLMNDGVRLIKLEGAELEAARRFTTIMQEGQEEIKRLREEHLRLYREVNERVALMLRAEWRKIVTAHGLDPVETWEGSAVTLDCEYIEHSTAFLRVIAEEGAPDLKGLNSPLDNLTMPAGGKLN